MGIAGLATQLEPYATRSTIAELHGYYAIIDGPALAYSALRLATETSADRLPSYADINAVAIRWLKSLEHVNINISAILFDGVLPTSKRDERSNRLQQTLRRVTQLRTLNSAASLPDPQRLGSAAYPFLPPALREALSSSEFAQRTSVVPGEADDYCAMHAKNNHRSIIVTGDTDLLLYHYHHETLIVFFKDIDIVTRAGAITVYSPSKICQQLQLPDLVSLAFAIQTDRWKPFKENVQKTRKGDIPLSQSRDFRQRYNDLAHASAPATEQPSLDESLQLLDARVSEFVHQAMSATSKSAVSPPLVISVFLPLLVEDPFQASAWSHGQAIRVLAYSLLCPQRLAILEHKRKAQAIVSQELQPYGPAEIASKAAQLLTTLTTFRTDPSLAPYTHWMLLATRLASDSWKAPHSSLLTRVVMNKFDNTWAFVHLTAYLHASLYSIRILKQCIPVWLALHEKDASSSLRATLTSLGNALASLPPISVPFKVPGQGIVEDVDEAQVSDAIKEIYASAGLDDPMLFEAPKTKSQRKREKRMQKRGDQTEPAKPQTSNPFTILESATQGS